ncbi:YkgJ family cysteine cluster protein [Haloplanus sp. GCM10025708]|uniref:YkgJ family cysteine cluster protein n=1 Tax=Haloferacaceae TaxID=1644056 RepID=UPI003605EBB5
MEMRCEGCAGCCLDWRPVSPSPADHERRGPRPPLDDAYNLVPLGRDEVRTFLDAGLGDALTPRLWAAASPAEAVTVDGVDVAGVNGRPAFVVGLRSVRKPVAPFGLDRTWLDACVFLDPETLRCRIHGGDRYPDACATYPGRNLELNQETECERVESAVGGVRLLDDDVPADLPPPLFGPQALGSRLFLHPDPGRLTGVVERVARGTPTAADRAEFVGVAAGSSPGTVAVNEARAARARERAVDGASWVSEAIEFWTERAGDSGTRVDPSAGWADVEASLGAPETEGW